ncbi:receptor-like serine/threonine-protein kinase SD1-8 [Solanum pennellii]|uniref:Receptor-like serine/threonine-protein kinase SD1-8 n=1 Tax=Solanum pennellii TaxID=28526 RepID=A0ABM1V6C5_SOLPN|nr:receptor-like serine/threonine-protein kinase SD1-8 [Solanum pennellii]
MTNNGVTVAVAAPNRTVVPQVDKPGKFTCVNFKGWQQRVFFWLSALGLQKFTSEETPLPADDMPDREKLMTSEAWKQLEIPRSDFLTHVPLDIFALQKKPLQHTLLLSMMKICSWETQQKQVQIGGEGSGNSSRKTKIVAIAAGVTVGIALVLFGLTLCILSKRRKHQSSIRTKSVNRGTSERSQELLMNATIIPCKREFSGETSTEEFELPLFDYSTLATATENFSDATKLGQGGFGCVYKAMLVGQEVAVKRLSKNSGQGVEEFKNELRLIARLQHRNLVRLLGCCVDMEEKMLIYEYLENKSLDSILFNKQKSSLLDWQKRFNIICGIARGLLYLHQDSRFRIIHRDLKASNILLDKDLTPKISDFGMARIFGGDETEGNTKRVVGTYGYMSPEYAMDGLFSVKSDVFSFGVLVLEIVTGKKKRGFYYQNNQLNLLTDHMLLAIHSSFDSNLIKKVGLLCVLEQAEDRPNMATVVLMLGSESASLPHPKNPGFCLGRRPVDSDSYSTNYEETCTVNQVIVTMIDPR